MHGKLFATTTTLQPPRRVVHSTMTARPGYANVDSSEYLDDDLTLRIKVKRVAELLLTAKKPILYTGAGISTASGIGDYASEAAGEKSMVHHKTRVLPYSALPTHAHQCLARLAMEKLTTLTWMQQNHDGLPQKAGFPQARLNEIHGAWYDPSNPVVPMSGSLRPDLYQWFEELEESTDCVLAMGTSLSGMNADRMVTTPSSKGFPTIIVSLQQTQLDAHASIRIFATTDVFADMLCEEMNVTRPMLKTKETTSSTKETTTTTSKVVVVEEEEEEEEKKKAPEAEAEAKAKAQEAKAQEAKAQEAKAQEAKAQEAEVAQEEGKAQEGVYTFEGENKEEKYYVPYSSADGVWLTELHEKKNVEGMTVLNLHDGAKVKLTIGPHTGDIGEVVGRDRQGHYIIIFQHRLKKTSKLTRPFERRLGGWWVKHAIEGTLTRLPIVNVEEV